MIYSVLRLADRSAESIMVPRGDIVWLDARIVAGRNVERKPSAAGMRDSCWRTVSSSNSSE